MNSTEPKTTLKSGITSRKKQTIVCDWGTAVRANVSYGRNLLQKYLAALDHDKRRRYVRIYADTERCGQSPIMHINTVSRIAFRKF